jgi:predicted ribosomally synthesized peptide with nif11-like leader
MNPDDPERTLDDALAALARGYDRAVPPAGIPARVADAIARGEPGADGPGAAESELVRFLERLRGDAALRSRIVRAGSPDARMDVLVTLAREQGFRFTAETARRALTRTRAANDGELTDEQLEAVAGGTPAAFVLLQSLLDGIS